MPHTLMSGGAPVPPTGITIEAGKELVLSLMLTGPDAVAGKKFAASSNAPAGDLTFDNVEITTPAPVASKSFLVWRAATGFVNPGSFNIELTETAPTPSPTSLVSVAVTVTPPVAVVPPVVTPPVVTPPVAPPTPPTGTAVVGVPITVTPPAPIALSLTGPTPPAPPVAPPTPAPVPNQTSPLIQALIALGALVIVVGLMMGAWHLVVVRTVDSTIGNLAAGVAAEQEVDDPVVLHTSDLSITLSADALDVSSGDAQSASQIMTAIHGLRNVPTPAPAPPSGP